MSRRTQVLVVDDDANIADLSRLYLERAGFAVSLAASGPAAIASAEAQRPDVVVLDVMLPGLSGWEVCRQLREISPVPILMLTAKGQIEDKVRGFQLGADDYLVKPFDPVELVARVKALLRRSGKPDRQVVSLQALEIDLDQYRVTYGGELVATTPKETELLYYFARHPNQVLNRDQLIRGVWGEDFDGDTRTVDAYVKRLRQKLSAVWKEPADTLELRTIWGVGYKLEVRA